MALIYLDNLRLNATLSGPAHGPVVVFLNALGTSLAIWDDLITRLPQTLRCLRFDHRGHGSSDAPQPPYAMGALIKDAERVMDHFALKDAVVVGLSLGGMVAQGLAVKRLDLVRGLVLSNTAAKIGTPDLWATRIAQVQANGLEAYADPAMDRMFGRHWRTIEGTAAVRQMLINTPAQGWIGCALAIAGTDFYTPTAGLTLPTLAIAGTNDGTTPPDLVRETAGLILGHRFELLRGAGHMPMVDKPQDYADLITGFLHSIGHA